MEVCVLCISPLAINERNKTERMTKRSEKESSERKRGKRAKTTRQNVKGNVRTTLGMKTEKAFTRQQRHPEAEGRSRLIQYDIRHGNPSLACSHPCRAMREQSSNELKKKKALPTDKKKKEQPVLHPKVHKGKCQIKSMGFSKYEENVYRSVLQSDAKIRF